jgi:hypothetical protein
MNEIIKWLESPEGEAWSRAHNRQGVDQHTLVTVKNDGHSRGKWYWLWIA